jgi:hypothetical protein
VKHVGWDSHAGWFLNTWSTVVRHVFWAHREVSGRWVQIATLQYICKVVVQKWIELQVHAQTRPVIGVNKLGVQAVYNINILTHQAHLQMQNYEIAAFVGQDEFYCIAISHPDKALSKNHVAAFVDGVFIGKSFAKTRMKPHLVAAGSLCTKANGVEYSRRALGHESEAFPISIVLHCFEHCFISGWLA